MIDINSQARIVMSSTQGLPKPNLRWTFSLVAVAIALALAWLALDGGRIQAGSSVEKPASGSLSQAHPAPSDVHLRTPQVGLQAPVSAAVTTQADPKSVPNDNGTLLVLALAAGLTLATSILLLAWKARRYKRPVPQELSLTSPSPVPGT